MEPTELQQNYRESLNRLANPQGQLQLTLLKLTQQLLASGAIIDNKLQMAMNAIHQDIKNLEVYSNRLFHQLDQVNGFMHTSAMLSSSLDLDTVLHEVMDTAINLTGAERAYLVLVEGEKFNVRAARNWDRESLVEQDRTFSQGIIKEALRKGEPVITFNAQGDARFQDHESIFVHDLRSIICIPLILSGKAVGVFYADNRSEKGIFDEGILPIANAFAQQAAIAIANAQTFKQVSTELDQARKEVRRLAIEIDRSKVESQVGEITDTDFFQELKSKAAKIRNKEEPNPPA